MKRQSGEPSRVVAQPFAERHVNLRKIDGQIVVEVRAPQRRRGRVRAAPRAAPDEEVGELGDGARDGGHVRRIAGDFVDDLREVFGKVIDFHDSAP